jgi:SAM-dependent methyltransferase
MPSIYSIYARWQPKFRAARMLRFRDTFSPTEATTILDIGGNHYDWPTLGVDCRFTILNVDDIPTSWEMPQNFKYVVGNGCAMEFPDSSFDIAYSNSVIEHLTTWDAQVRFASETRRVGRAVYVQTPNRWFPIEPHFLAIFLHWLPRSTHRFLFRWFSIRGWLRRGDNVNLDTLVGELRLLSYREMKTLFPDCEIRREKWMGLTKSFIAIRRTL